MFIFVDETGKKVFPLNQGNLLELFPSTSFPKPLPVDGIPSMGIYPLVYLDAPEHNPDTESAKQKEPELVQGVWTVGWQVEALSAEEIEVNLQKKADFQRNLRNGRLQQSDWTQLPDAPVDKSAWLIYRQALRDVTSQPGFPVNVNWPDEPEA